MPEKSTAADIRTQAVGAIVTKDFRTAAVFERYGIDFCCGGDVALGEACRAARVDPARVEKDLASIAAAPPSARDADFASWTLTRLIDHIKAVHHRYLRENTARTGAYARKITEVHGAQHPELAEISATYDAMASALMAHLDDEEQVFFLAVKRAEASARAGEAVDPADAETLRTGAEQLAAEHDEVGGALHRIRDLSMGYALPADSCATYDLTYRNLEELEADIHKHVHLENNILLPRAAALVE
jgi:regulator of cell morphogenesis and NO signaling